jgi:hypothetical protein
MLRLQHLDQLHGQLLLHAKALLHIGLWVAVVAVQAHMTKEVTVAEVEGLL